ncbi:unnamed protein product [Acanthoscelides obtectus]|uniref:Uncharacterized protein n=1 Tax=Acanthoscelides obtectus TaxID=200917 RepID=A0A9P0LLM8_ACAOB|nr:unnamed protein product [Acanthoscelides obtectus]CAK1681161.1 hypothetical protein AOBTE_LOCUS33041 [Acanthoscelides obtectus]
MFVPLRLWHTERDLSRRAVIARSSWREAICDATQSAQCTDAGQSEVSYCCIMFAKSRSQEVLLLLFALQKKKKNKRRYWVHDINKKREQCGEYHRLCIELRSHEDKFFQYFRMSKACFEELHELIKVNIEKCTTNWRKPIDTRQKLSICLRYLATGDRTVHSIQNSERCLSRNLEGSTTNLLAQTHHEDVEAICSGILRKLGFPELPWKHRREAY